MKKQLYPRNKYWIAIQLYLSMIHSFGYHPSHNKDEVLYLIKIILGIAMQCPQKNLFLMRITELPGEIRDILSPIAEEVLATMQVPEEYVDDEHLKSFEEMMEEVGSEENEDDWGDWNDTETPVDTFCMS